MIPAEAEIQRWRGLQAEIVWCRLELRSRGTAYFPGFGSPGEYACTSARLCSLKSWSSWNGPASLASCNATAATPACLHCRAPSSSGVVPLRV